MYVTRRRTWQTGASSVLAGSFITFSGFPGPVLTPGFWQPSLFAQADGPSPDCVGGGVGFRTQCAMAGTCCI